MHAVEAVSSPHTVFDAKSLAASQAIDPTINDQDLETLSIPKAPSAEFATVLQQALLRSSFHPSGIAAASQVAPAPLVHHIVSKVIAQCIKEPTLLELAPNDQRVTVVGDTHGHIQDVCHMFDTFGVPSADRIYIFNGDFVDRGSWGLETLLLLLTYKWLLPNNVFLIRGNHEASYCTKVYGFKNELLAKYGQAGKGLYKDVLRLFAQLPLAALVAGNTLILHGGLFRAPPEREKGKPKYKNLGALPEGYQLRTGSLQDLRQAGKGGVDPDPDVYMSQLIASDVLWSDPSTKAGQVLNNQRFVGTRFGPDVTEEFMRSNNVSLIIRSHEGPDARAKRPADDRMPSIDEGYCVDHDTPCGKLVTLFSSPCYPMHTPKDEQPFHNKGAVLHLTAPQYATPDVQQFEAVLPRPPALLFYEPNGGLSDSETEDESDMQPTCSASSAGADVSPSQPCGDTATSAAGAAAKVAGAQPFLQQQGQDGLVAAAAADAAALFKPVAEVIVGAAVSGEHKARSPKRQRS